MRRRRRSIKERDDNQFINKIVHVDLKLLDYYTIL